MRRLGYILAALLLLGGIVRADDGWRTNQNGMNFSLYNVGEAQFNDLAGSGTRCVATDSGGNVLPMSYPCSGYRSDLPLSTTWFVDPVNGSDVASNPGTSSATALKTLQELARRWWNATISTNTTVTILGNVPSSDLASWNFTIVPNVNVVFRGSLGPTTGFGGATINNTLYIGSVTAFTGASSTPAADDIEMTDSAIPTSFTASGLLANGVIFRRLVPSELEWYALKDLGGKTIRMTSPMLNSSPATFQSMTVGNAYSAYAMWTFPGQTFNVAEPSDVTLDSLTETGSIDSRAVGRSRVWHQPFTAQMGVVTTNSLLQGSKSFTSPDIESYLIGGGARGSGSDQITLFNAWLGFVGPFVSQGVELQTDDSARISVECQIAVHDTTIPAISAFANGVVYFNGTSSGMSGKGNTSKLVSVTLASRFTYGFSAAHPPFAAGSSSDGSPIQIGAASYAVSALPTSTTDVAFPSETNFPSSIYETGGPTRLVFDAVPASTLLYRNGALIQGATVGTGLSLSGGTLTATGGGGTVTSVTASAPIFSSGGTTPNITEQGALVSGSTSTTAQDLGSISTSMLSCSTSGGICTVDGVTVSGGLNFNTSTATETLANLTCGSNTFVSSASTSSGLVCTQPTIGNLAGIPADTLVGNPTSSSAAPTAVTLGADGSLAFSGSTLDGGKILVSSGDGLAGYLSSKLTSSAPITLTVVGGGAPPSTGLKLWLEAGAGVTLSGSNVTAWADQSGNGNNCSQATGADQPTFSSSTIGGQPGLVFSGSQFLTGAANLDTGSSARTLVVILKSSTTQAGSVFTYGTGGSRWITWDGLSGITGATWSDTTNIATSTPSTASTPSALTWSSAGPGTNVINYSINGTAQTVTTGNWTNTSSRTGYTVAANTTVQGFNGTICEILAYDHVLSGADFATLYGYLGAKYSITIAGAGGVSVTMNAALTTDSTLKTTAGALGVDGINDGSGAPWLTSGTWSNNQALITSGGNLTTTSECNVFSSCSAGGGLSGTYPNPTVASVPCTALPALTGGIFSSAGSCATTLSSSSVAGAATKLHWMVLDNVPAAGRWIITSSTAFTGLSALEYPNDFQATHIQTKANFIASVVAGGFSCFATLNGSGIAGTSLTYSGTLGVQTSSTLPTGSSSVNDTYGIECTPTASGGGTINFSYEMVLTL
jgi:hypothetical protein